MPFALMPVGVGLVKRMTLLAMGQGTRISPRILTARDGLKMSGVHARLVPANMVNGQTDRDRSYQQFVGEPMGADVPFVEPKDPVTFAISGGSP